MNKTWRIATIVGVLAVCVLTLVSLYGSNAHQRFTKNGSATTTTTTATSTATTTAESDRWMTYSDETYHFTMVYPARWRVVSSEFVGYPRISFYDPNETGGAQPPFDHHANAVHVSVYPKGVPSEGIFGETDSTKINMQEHVKSAINFIMDDSMPWASMITFSTFPASWNEGGFVFARALIHGESTSCLRGSETVSENTCDPMTGDVIVRKGTVDPDVRATEVRMLESFRFVK